MYKSIILPLAKWDIEKAAIWYNSKQKGLGQRFMKAIHNKVLLIRQSPKIFPVRYDDIRTAVLDIFPFMIHYTVDDEQKTVIISAVFHTSRNPDMWKKRE